MQDLTLFLDYTLFDLGLHTFLCGHNNFCAGIRDFPDFQQDYTLYHGLHTFPQRITHLSKGITHFFSDCVSGLHTL